MMLKFHVLLLAPQVSSFLNMTSYILNVIIISYNIMLNIKFDINYHKYRT